MQIALSNVRSTVVRSDQDDEESLDEALAFQVPNYFWSTAYRNGQWDGYRRFYNKTAHSFPSGLLPYALNILRPLGIRVRLDDRREQRYMRASTVMPPAAWATRLRKRGFHAQPLQCVFQYLAVRALTRSRLRGFRWARGLGSMPTGSGKTLSALWAAECFPGRALYLVPRQDLLLQGEDVYAQLHGRKPGRVGMGAWKPKRFTMAMIQTLAPRAADRNDVEAHDFLRSIQTVIVDEAHLVGDNGYVDVMDRCTEAGVRFAFGGSLLRRTDDLGDWFLLSTFGNRLYHLPSKKLRDAGLLAEIRAFAIPIRAPVLSRQVRYTEAEKLGIIHNGSRNGLAVRIALRAAKHNWITLVLVQKRDHGVAVQRAFAQAGHRVPFLCYRDPAQLRKHYIEAMRDEATKIVIASGIFNMGIDAPIVRCIIRLDGGKSEIASLQIPGRGMRFKAELNECFLIDFADETSHYFRDHWQSRLSVYREEQYPVEVVGDVEAIPFRKLCRTRPAQSSSIGDLEDRDAEADADSGVVD